MTRSPKSDPPSSRHSYLSSSALDRLSSAYNNRQSRTYAIVLVGAFILMACGLILHLRSGYLRQIADWRARETSIADEQATMVGNWARERAGDVDVLSERRWFRNLVVRSRERAQGARKAPLDSDTVKALDEVTRAYTYQAAYIVDRDLHVVAHSTDAEQPAPAFLSICESAIETRSLQIAVSGSTPEEALVAFAAPIPETETSGIVPRGGGERSGVVLLVARASQVIYPLILRENATSRSAETVIAKQDEDSVVLFCPLRGRGNSTEFLRIPSARVPTPERTALAGQHSFVEARDYRGETVLASTTTIPILNWGLVRKIDRSEALAPFYQQSALETLAVGLLLALLWGLGLVQKRGAILEAIQQEGEKFRLLFETAPDAVYLVEPGALRILGRNRRAKERDGLTDEEAAAVIFPDLYSPQERGELRRLLSQHSQKAQSGIYHHVEKNGALVPVEENISWVDTGREQFILAVEHDLSERKRAEEAAAYMALIVGASNDAIIGCSLDGTIQSWNSGAERIYGYPASEAIGQSILLNVQSEDREEIQTTLEAIRRGDRVVHHETKRIRKDGTEIYMSVTVSPLKDTDGKITGASSIERDITEQKNAEAQIRELNLHLEHRVAKRTEELQAANQELEAFAYSVSHDLRAPLRHIDGFSKMLVDQNGAELSADAREFLDLIRTSVRQMGTLIDNLLDLARVGRRRVSTERIDLMPLVEEIVSDLTRANPERTLDWRIGDMPTVECDRTLIKQVFVNLISNAVKYTRPRDVAIIEVGACRQENVNAVFVRDNGVGFNMKYANKLFGVFQRLHSAEEFEGTGVGLAIVHRIVQKHGGRVWAESALDHGATFYFTLAPGHHE